jgi:hypothetical protein
MRSLAHEAGGHGLAAVVEDEAEIEWHVEVDAEDDDDGVGVVGLLGAQALATPSTTRFTARNSANALDVITARSQASYQARGSL